MKFINTELSIVEELGDIEQKYKRLLDNATDKDILLKLLFFAEYYQKHPEHIDIEGLTFAYWKLVGKIHFGCFREILVGCVSNGHMFIEARGSVKKLLGQSKTFQYLEKRLFDLNTLYLDDFEKFFSTNFVIELASSRLPSTTKKIILTEYQIKQHQRIADIFNQCYLQKIETAVKRCLFSGYGEQLFEMSIGKLVEKFCVRVDKRALQLRTEIAEKYKFVYDEINQRLLKIKGNDKVIIYLSEREGGKVFINGRFVCIEVDNKDIPSDDIIVAKILSLAIPELRERVYTLKRREKTILRRIFGK
ncbi:MAG: hypothetical protein ACTSR3_18315 [Candidatus Helarchaeota archaeon]